MLSTKAVDSSRFFFKKVLNVSQVGEATLLCLILLLGYYQQKRIIFFKKEAAKDTRLWLLAPIVLNWSSYC